MNRLTARSVESRRKPGYYADGGGLYLQVAPGGTKSWLYRFMLNGRAREMGLGPLHTVSLAEARVRAARCRQLRLQGIDPIEARNDAITQQRIEDERSVTFEKCAEAYVQAHRTGWRNAKHADQWTNTLRTYAYPVFGAMPVHVIDTALVMKVIEPLWTTKTETGTRLRGRIESVLDWATVRGYRTGENPASWRGHLDKLLPKRSKVAKVKHHPALPYAETPAFMADLRGREGVAPKALEFVILTAVRVSEAVNAQWSEFDLEAKVWTIPDDRMKAAREHRVPLSPPVLQILKALAKHRQSDYVFPGWKAEQPLSSAACLKLLADMNRGDITVHGFRSTFRDWCAEQTNFPRELAEAALAHVLKDKTEAAYQRGDLLERRRKLMEKWATYCGSAKRGEVVELAPRRKGKA